jgi:hypothetical protein
VGKDGKRSCVREIIVDAAGMKLYQRLYKPAASIYDSQREETGRANGFVKERNGLGLRNSRSWRGFSEADLVK